MPGLEILTHAILGWQIISRHQCLPEERVFYDFQRAIARPEVTIAIRLREKRGR